MKTFLSVVSLGLLTTTVGLTAQELPTKAGLTFEPVDRASVELGRLLFSDPILSGAKETACISCHGIAFGTSDGMSLGLGEGAFGDGLNRVADPNNVPKIRIPRNAPAVYNVGALEVTRFFHDGRLFVDDDEPLGVRTPVGEAMLEGANSFLANQTLLPVLSIEEMAGDDDENEISAVLAAGETPENRRRVWEMLAERVQAVPEYRMRFADLKGNHDPISFIDVANTLADFLTYEFRADNSPFDAYLRGEGDMHPGAMWGMELFYGKAGCSGCHSGSLLSDQEMHAIAMPQFGPGKAHARKGYADLGLGAVTGRAEDNYKFKTPTLRNVALTAPYGHSGAYATLEGVVRHHLDPVNMLYAYNINRAQLPVLEGVDDRRPLLDDAEMKAIADANELEPVKLDDLEVAALVAFLQALTDPVAYTGRIGPPTAVPSGLVRK